MVQRYAFALPFLHWRDGHRWFNTTALAGFSLRHQKRRGGFITACCARFYPDGRVVVANAGHISPYLAGREVMLENGLPLGISPDATYGETEIQTDGALTFLSDGVVEARDAKGELLGFERMAALTTKPATEIADAAQR